MMTSRFKKQRVALAVVQPVEDRNCGPQYEIQKAAWVWHPDCADEAPAVLRFRNAFILDSETTLRVHVSADERYELYLDGEFLSKGPDRSDPEHWSFATYDLVLPPGEHLFEAWCWKIGRTLQMPLAQMTLGAGFIFRAEGALAQALDTPGRWQTARIPDVAFVPIRAKAVEKMYFVTGPAQISGPEYWNERGREWKTPRIVHAPIPQFTHGATWPGWCLQPSPLPDQLMRSMARATVRAVKNGDDPLFTQADCQSSAVAAWSALIAERRPLSIPPRTVVSVLFDLDNYYCGYSDVVVSGGADAQVAIEWAEALLEDEDSWQKGNRDRVDGKRFLGADDAFTLDGGEQRRLKPLWWRAGRYIRLTVKTREAPLRVEAFGILETRYPLENEGRFACSDQRLNALVPLLARGIQMCSHETYMDCPFYEQLMYAGDMRLQILAHYVMSHDDRLVKRALELFDHSRWRTGFVAMAYPRDGYHLSLTFTMLWIMMIRDFAWWRDDPAWVRERLTGVRCVLEHFLPFLNSDGLLRRLPGWSFIDWTWKHALAVKPDEASASVNLLFVHALLAAAELEDTCGESVLAERNRAQARRVMARAVETFWTGPANLFAEDETRTVFSEHAQALALLTGLLGAEREQSCLDALIRRPDLERATVYFSFYILEVFRKFRRPDLLLQRLEDWNAMLTLGLKTPMERPEPSRSDCHGWGSHPLFHFHASLAGIRPDAPGFKRVRISPQPAGLSMIESSLPHPQGEVTLTMTRHDGQWRVLAKAPRGIPGVVEWQNETRAL